jgi:hypothetical protein
LSRLEAEAVPEHASTLYIDGHVRVYILCAAKFDGIQKTYTSDPTRKKLNNRRKKIVKPSRAQASFIFRLTLSVYKNANPLALEVLQEPLPCIPLRIFLFHNTKQTILHHV